MFQSGLKESHELIIPLQNVESLDILQSVLEFIVRPKKFRNNLLNLISTRTMWKRSQKKLLLTF